MANGQQKAQHNLDSFIVWTATQQDDDFKNIVYRGQLNRGEIAKAIGCGKSALTQNPEIRSQLKQLEDDLREKGILPQIPSSVTKVTGEPKKYDSSANSKVIDSNRLTSLETENFELKAEVKELKIKLKRFGELSETLSEMGFMPR
ncbi:hypothetical protein H5202_21165 [Shewanella sp. SG41-4]|uniref:VPA1267 family protein n=1 Tax=Shewanella sp. SG41-4 TaxID=2760976 RepID=UPI0015FF17C4|nr:VPA1267 family protein [Shewanella sp. SG41-4]MBB1441110.1 hypothetical protein [Shewanella sp. SG41-4]